MFQTTHWSVVLAARDEDDARSAAALDTLCRAYWFPLYALARRQGHAPEDAEDLTQSFFARLLAKDFLLAASPERGRFRTFMVVAMKRFLANEWDRARAKKRGGGDVPVPLDTAAAEARLASDSEEERPPESGFDRDWAVTLLARAMARLESEHDQGHTFAAYRRFLEVGEPEASYRQAAADLGLNETAVRMAVHRLRRRFRTLLREEIAATVAQSEDIDEELRHLLRVLSR